MKCLVWGQDTDKWLIRYSTLPSSGRWIVYPPNRSFGRHTTFHRTFEEARLDFIRQTAHVRPTSGAGGLRATGLCR